VTPYYADDRVILYCGDDLAVIPHLQTVDAVVTSPPYNQLGGRVPAEGSGMFAGNGWITEVNDNGYRDDMTEAEYLAWQTALGDALADVVRPGGSFFYNHKIRYRDGRPLHPIDIVRSWDGWELRQEVVWDRRRAMAFNARMFPPSDERIYWMVRPGTSHKWNQDAARWLSVWQMAPPRDAAGHPCPFPEQLVTRCVTATTDPGDTVLDPYAGSGTTLRVARDLGRKVIGIERREDYCAIAVDRLRQQTLDLDGGAA
jgi:site-specific DNA-methyltransferase (adenine-specific)